jgi:AraC-like DNA-binding protein
MAETCVLTIDDPDGYAAGFGDARIDFTITGAGDFEARLTRLTLEDLGVYRCSESLARIAYISLPPAQTFLSFPLGTTSLVSEGFVLRNGDMVLHGRGESAHQRSNGACQWGLIALSPGRLESCSKALTGRQVVAPHASRILHPAAADVSRFRHLFRQACHLAEARNKFIERPEVARALEQELLHAVTNCVAVDGTGRNPKNHNPRNYNSRNYNSRTRHNHAVVMGRFEESLSKHTDEKLTMPELCAEIGVPERSLRLCCTKFLGVSPMRYLLLRRLNKVRSALRHADPSIATVAEVARNHQFRELGRFSVTYRTVFGESPSVTLQRDPQIRPAAYA